MATSILLHRLYKKEFLKILQFTVTKKILYMLGAFPGYYIYLRFRPVHCVQKENLT